ncbi:MAG: DMT family transporter [Nostocales cyanobacterium W4_Combined_metabat2_030]|nr:DMT family transporter [Nostocales cyanobacterium W4_Combined_metabat2_030]
MNYSPKNSVAADDIPQPIKSENFWSFLSLLGGLISFSFVPVFTKWSAMEISAETTIFDRFVLTTIILGLGSGILAFYRQLTKKLEPSPTLHESAPRGLQLLGLLLLTGTFFAGMLLTLAWSLIHTTVANCEMINNLTPVFTVLGGWLLFKQRFDRRFLLGCAIAISGLLVIGFNDFQIGIDKLQGDFLALGSAVCLSAYLLGAEKLRNHLNTDTVLLGCFSSGLPLTLVVLAINQESLFPNSGQGWLAIFSMSGAGLLGQGMLLYSLKKLSSGFVALVFLLTPFTAAILAWIMFSETLSLSNLFAFFVVVLGLSLTITSSSTFKESDNNIPSSINYSEDG